MAIQQSLRKTGGHEGTPSTPSPTPTPPPTGAKTPAKPGRKPGRKPGSTTAPRYDLDQISADLYVNVITEDDLPMRVVPIHPSIRTAYDRSWSEQRPVAFPSVPGAAVPTIVNDLRRYAKQRGLGLRGPRTKELGGGMVHIAFQAVERKTKKG